MTPYVNGLHVHVAGRCADAGPWPHVHLWANGRLVHAAVVRSPTDIDYGSSDDDDDGQRDTYIHPPGRLARWLLRDTLEDRLQRQVYQLVDRWRHAEAEAARAIVAIGQ